MTPSIAFDAGVSDEVLGEGSRLVVYGKDKGLGGGRAIDGIEMVQEAGGWRGVGHVSVFSRIPYRWVL